MTSPLARSRALIGTRVGRLKLIGISSKRADNNRFVGIFRCDCGTIKRYALSRVIKQQIHKSCGCDIDRGAHARTHGMRNSSEYRVWTAMRGRCLSKTHKDYPRYGGRGVTLDPSWAASFENFYAHVGPRPAGTTLDRIDNTKGYWPGNVRWATASEQQRNRSSACVWHIKGLQFETMYEAAAHFGVSTMTVGRWVKGAFDARRNAFTKPREDCYAISRYPTTVRKLDAFEKRSSNSFPRG